jgi:hypothetical protein
MDSRIREIEQWIAEAKHDLGERGREAYLEKLYLLDAEIRNVIRENGVPPQSASPRPAVRRVRRWHAPQALASGAAFGIMLLAASTVYFASPGAVLSWQPQEPPVRLASSVENYSVNVPAGEELLPVGSLESHLTTKLPSSPSEEKAGEKTPSDMQAPVLGVASPGNSKPTALAHSLGQAPASTTPKVKVQDKPDATPAKQLLALAAKPEAQPLIKLPKPKPTAAAGAKAKPAVPTEEVAIIPVSLTTDVDKNAVDNGDKAKVIDTKALQDVFNKSLETLDG